MSKLYKSKYNNDFLRATYPFSHDYITNRPKYNYNDSNGLSFANNRPFVSSSANRQRPFHNYYDHSPFKDYTPLKSSAYSQIEETILKSVNPIPLQCTQPATVNGETGFLVNQHEIESWRGELPISKYCINGDTNPTVIRKKPKGKVVYDQRVSVRYLNPPSPPPHGDIVIKEQPNIPTEPAPPIVLRQEPSRPVTPPPVVIREAPPQAPRSLPPKLIQVPGKRIPPPPRKVVIEKLPLLPPKPHDIILEKWLPYKEPTRRVIFERNTIPDPIVQPQKNLIIQWESPDVIVTKQFENLGVVNADPYEYIQQYGSTLKEPTEFQTLVNKIQPPNGLGLATNYQNSDRHRLIGDIHALSLIDLDCEGLSEYKKFEFSEKQYYSETLSDITKCGFAINNNQTY